MPGPTIYDYRMIYHDVGGHTVSFEAANQDLTDPEYQYFGFISSFGSWIIQRFHIIDSAVIYEYAAGQKRTDYDTHWDGGTGLFVAGDPALEFTTFDLINEEFLS